MEDVELEIDRAGDISVVVLIFSTVNTSITIEGD